MGEKPKNRPTKTVVIGCTGGGSTSPVPYQSYEYPLYTRLTVYGTPDEHHLISGFEITNLENGFTKFARGQNVLDIIVDANLSIKAVFVPRGGVVVPTSCTLEVDTTPVKGNVTIEDAQSGEILNSGQAPLTAKRDKQWIAKVTLDSQPGLVPSTFTETFPVFSNTTRRYTYIPL